VHLATGAGARHPAHRGLETTECAWQHDLLSRLPSSIDPTQTAVRVISLDLLERNKIAVGRAKDLLDIEAIAEIRKRR